MSRIIRRKRRLPLRVEDIMSTPPITIDRNAKIRVAARLMHDNRVGSVLVVDDEGKLIGIVTERDIVFACAEGWSADQHEVWEIMTENPITIKPSDTIGVALEKMGETGVRHLPVVDDEGKPVGVVAFRDIANTILMLMEMGVIQPGL